MHFRHRQTDTDIIAKALKIVFDRDRGSAPDPSGRAHDVPPDL